MRDLKSSRKAPTSNLEDVAGVADDDTDENAIKYFAIRKNLKKNQTGVHKRDDDT